MRRSISNSKHGSFLFKINENTYPKGRALMQMNIVIHQTKRGNYKCLNTKLGFIPKTLYNT